jgi:16S rRNA (uracil1498-N3)-methyltransferase
MRKPRIHTTAALRENSRVQLQGAAGHYLSRVLRRDIGDRVYLFNGSGGEYEAQILSIVHGNAELEVLQLQAGECESPLVVHLGLAISRGERMDWAVQKATELGVNALTPLLSEHGEVKLSAGRSEKKCRHWQQIAISACEQCGRNSIPFIHPSQSLGHWLQGEPADLALVLAAGGNPLQHWSTARPTSLKLLIGPEGGLSDTELAAATAAGFEVAALGPRILRTETAPVAALSLAQYLWGDF